MNNTKLIRLSTTHYVVIDDSKLVSGDKCIANGATYDNAIVEYRRHPSPPPYVTNTHILKKITHSTIPIEGTILIKHSDIEELIYGFTIDLSKLCYYDRRNPDHDYVEELPKKHCTCDNCFYGRAKLTEKLIEIRGKMFTSDDITHAIGWGEINEGCTASWKPADVIISLLPSVKGEWDVKINGDKITLL